MSSSGSQANQNNAIRSLWRGIESLEPRQMLSMDAGDDGQLLPVIPGSDDMLIYATGAPLGGGAGPVITRGELTTREVRRILGQAASQAEPGQIIAVSDREGFILGIFEMAGGDPENRDEVLREAVMRARTAAYFQSHENAFTTRTARFIIQDHFPQPVPNTGGGPLYGVQFSSLPGTDILQANQVPAISGDPGGIPLFKAGRPVGGIGVSGDGLDFAPREDLIPAGPAPYDNPDRRFFNGQEESDFDEAVALAGARGFEAPAGIRATNITIDGLRLPFTANTAANDNPNRGLKALIDDDAGDLTPAPGLGKASARIIPPPPEENPVAQLGPIPGHIMDPIISSNDRSDNRLTARDVRVIIRHAVQKANNLRAGIRLPINVPVRVHISVVDRNGDLLGTYRMEDGTRFSYDVAVQKARTAAFFSDDNHAFSSRAVGFMAQRFFPAGQDDDDEAPLFHLQNALSRGENLKGPLRNGITIFPGGVPLYKNGELVGAIGVSGDGVDEDDEVAFGGTRGFRPRAGIRSDALSGREIERFIARRVRQLGRNYDLTVGRFGATDDQFGDLEEIILGRLADPGLEEIELPFVKFKRNSGRFD